MATTRLDITRSGSRDPNENDVERVLAYVREYGGPGRKFLLADAAKDLRMQGRTVRAILAKYDATDKAGFVLAGGDDGYHIAESVEDAEGMTRRILGTARSLERRADRRRGYGGLHLPRKQPLLPGLDGVA